MFNFKKQLGNAIQRTVRGKESVLIKFWAVVISSTQVPQIKSGGWYLAI